MVGTEASQHRGASESWGRWRCGWVVNPGHGVSPGALPAVKNPLTTLYVFSQFHNFVGFSLDYFGKWLLNILSCFWKPYSRQPNTLLWDSLFVEEKLGLEDGVRVVPGKDTGRCKTTVEEVWRGYSATQGSGGTQQLPLAAALPCGWWFVPAGSCAHAFESVHTHAEPQAWGETRQLWQHIYTLFTRPRRVLLGLEYGQQVMLCLWLVLILLEKQNHCDSVWVMPCEPQIVYEIHGEKQFKILCLCIFCVVETVKPLSCSERRLGYLQRERNCRWFSNRLIDAKS